ncbi:MAG: hypothetical protein PHI93_01050 [Kiritimatiellae bacterium]|nr:hypothetical protein [Kiritimatiellia bacterium]
MNELTPAGVFDRKLRARERRARMVTHRACNFDDAENWDLTFWQSKTPQERLSALIAIRNDVEKVQQARQNYERNT